MTNCSTSSQPGLRLHTSHPGPGSAPCSRSLFFFSGTQRRPRENAGVAPHGPSMSSQCPREPEYQALAAHIVYSWAARNLCAIPVDVCSQSLSYLLQSGATLSTHPARTHALALWVLAYLGTRPQTLQPHHAAFRDSKKSYVFRIGHSACLSFKVRGCLARDQRPEQQRKQSESGHQGSLSQQRLSCGLRAGGTTHCTWGAHTIVHLPPNEHALQT